VRRARGPSGTATDAASTATDTVTNAADTVTNKAHLLKMAAGRDPLRTEVGEQFVQIRVQGSCEIEAETAPDVSLHRESEPVLLHLGETVPDLQEIIPNRAGCGSVPEKNQVANHLIMKLTVFFLVTVKQQKRVDE
jgi:hypothetical protein